MSGTSDRPEPLNLAARRIPSFRLKDENLSPTKKMKKRTPSFRNNAPGNSAATSDDIEVHGGRDGRRASFNLGHLNDLDFLGPMESGFNFGPNLSGPTVMGMGGKRTSFTFEDNYLLSDTHRGGPGGMFIGRMPSFRGNMMELADLDFICNDDSVEALAGGPLGFNLGERPLSRPPSHYRFMSGMDVGSMSLDPNAGRTRVKRESFDLDTMADRRVSSGSNLAGDSSGGGGSSAFGHPNLPSFTGVNDEMLDDPMDDDIHTTSTQQMGSNSGGAGAAPRPIAFSNTTAGIGGSGSFFNKKNSFSTVFDAGALDLGAPASAPIARPAPKSRAKKGAGVGRGRGGHFSADSVSSIDLESLLVELADDGIGVAPAGTAAAAARSIGALSLSGLGGGCGMPTPPSGRGSPGCNNSSSDGCGGHFAKRQTSEEVSKRLPVRVLEDFYHVPLNIAAKELNVSLTMLKKLCRQYGIKRWPHRQVSSLNKSLSKLENKVATCKDAKSEKALQGKLEHMVLKRLLIIKIASAGLEPDILNVIFSARPCELEKANLLNGAIDRDPITLRNQMLQLAKQKKEGSGEMDHGAGELEQDEEGLDDEHDHEEREGGGSHTPEPHGHDADEQRALMGLGSVGLGNSSPHQRQQPSLLYASGGSSAFGGFDQQRFAKHQTNLQLQAQLQQMHAQHHQAQMSKLQQGSVGGAAMNVNGALADRRASSFFFDSAPPQQQHPAVGKLSSVVAPSNTTEGLEGGSGGPGDFAVPELDGNTDIGSNAAGKAKQEWLAAMQPSTKSDASAPSPAPVAMAVNAAAAGTPAPAKDEESAVTASRSFPMEVPQPQVAVSLDRPQWN